MKPLVIYRILTYPLLLMGAFMGIGAIIALPIALANPVTLASVFLLVCIVIYTYASWRFLIKGISRQLPLKPSLRKLIKVNGYATIVFSGMMLIQAILLLSDPNLLSQFAEMARSSARGASTSADDMMQRFRGVLILLEIYSFILLVHVNMTFKLLKPYGYLFGDKPAEQEEG